jgi:hypothetical protein
MIEKSVADERVQAGWLRAWLAFEALAVSEDVTRSTLEELVNKLDSDARVKVYKKSFGQAIKREKPLKNIEFGWSITVEVELVAKSLQGLLSIIMEYGPSSVEVLEPAKFSVGAGEAQNILNMVASMMHEYAAAGLGGIVFLRGSEQ